MKTTMKDVILTEYLKLNDLREWIDCCEDKEKYLSNGRTYDVPTCIKNGDYYKMRKKYTLDRLIAMRNSEFDTLLTDWYIGRLLKLKPIKERMMENGAEKCAAYNKMEETTKETINKLIKDGIGKEYKLNQLNGYYITVGIDTDTNVYANFKVFASPNHELHSVSLSDTTIWSDHDRQDEIRLEWMGAMAMSKNKTLLNEIAEAIQNANEESKHITKKYEELRDGIIEDGMNVLLFEIDEFYKIKKSWEN